MKAKKGNGSFNSGMYERIYGRCSECGRREYWRRSIYNCKKQQKTPA